MSSLLASAGPSVLDQASAALSEACEQRLWAQSDSDIVDPVRAALRVRAQADASMLVRTGKSLREGFESTGVALIGRRLAECIDPEGTQARDEKKHLEREKTAHHKRGLTVSPDKDGAGRYLRGYLDTEGAAIIAAALDGLSATIPDTAAGQPDRRSPAQRRHDALVELGRHQLQTGQLPSTGGIKPRIVITIPYKSVTGGTGAGRLDVGLTFFVGSGLASSSTRAWVSPPRRTKA